MGKKNGNGKKNGKKKKTKKEKKRKKKVLLILSFSFHFFHLQACLCLAANHSFVYVSKGKALNMPSTREYQNGQCGLPVSCRAIDLRDTDTHISSFSCHRSLFFQTNQCRKKHHERSACQSILELLRHVTLELKQRVISGLFYFFAGVSTASGSLADSNYPLLRANEVNFKSSRVLG